MWVVFIWVQNNLHPSVLTVTKGQSWHHRTNGRYHWCGQVWVRYYVMDHNSSCREAICHGEGVLPCDYFTLLLCVEDGEVLEWFWEPLHCHTLIKTERCSIQWRGGDSNCNKWQFPTWPATQGIPVVALNIPVVALNTMITINLP